MFQDVVLLCFSVISTTSFKNVRDLWIPELIRHNVGTPIILVGMKSDLREDPAELERLKDEKEKYVRVDEHVNEESVIHGY